MKRVRVVMLLFLVSQSYAAHPLSTDDAGIVGTSAIEVEAGYETTKSAGASRGQVSGVSIKSGISERMDIGVSIPYTIAPLNAENCGNASLGLKFSLMKDILALSISNEAGAKAYFMNGILSWPMENMNLHLNAGYQSSGDPDIEGAAVYRLAYERCFTTIDLVGEVYHNGVDAGEWLVGVRYGFEKIGFVDMAAGMDFNGETDTLVCGFHTEF